VEESFFQQYKVKGFKNVRIPVCWDLHTATKAPYTINATWLDTVEEYVDWSLSRNMTTILNTHHEKWLDEAGDNFDKKLPRLLAIWSQIAERFGGKSPSLIFEIFNEPVKMSTAQLNEMNAAVLPVIREKHPYRIVLFMGLKFGNPSWIAANNTALHIPDDDGYLMLEVHNYDPWKYAGSNPTVHEWGSDEDVKTLTNWMDKLQVREPSISPIFLVLY